MYDSLYAGFYVLFLFVLYAVPGALVLLLAIQEQSKNKGTLLPACHIRNMERFKRSTTMSRYISIILFQYQSAYAACISGQRGVHVFDARRYLYTDTAATGPLIRNRHTAMSVNISNDLFEY